MADEKKIVPEKAKTKKAAAKKAVAKKTVTKKATSRRVVTKKKVAAAKKVATKKAVAARPAAAAAARQSAPPQPKPVSEPQSALLPSESPSEVSPELRAAMIQEAAYFKAEKRNFAPGFEAEDWDEAEREVDEKLKRGNRLIAR
jgi:hypothetical protein